jgi:UDP-glucose 4-epimerase
MAQYLVTGAAGFIGGAVASRLIKKGNEVVTIDNLSTGYEEAIPEDVVFYNGDCQDEHLVKQLEKYNFDAIFHIAGQSSGEISYDDPVYDLQTNAQSTLLLLKLAQKTNCKKFIYASTMSVYGAKEDKLIDENELLEPKSFYGVGKIASEQYMRIYQDYGITSTALRLFNIYGPGQNLKNLRQGMVSIFVAQAICQQYILVKGSEDRFRDFVFVDDVVDAFIAAYKRESNDYLDVNISNARKTTVKELISLIQDNIPFDVKTEFKGSTSGDIFGIVGNNSKAFDTLNWKPKIKLEEGLKDMIEWALKLKTQE